MPGFDPDKFLAQPQGFDPDAFLRQPNIIGGSVVDQPGSVPLDVRQPPQASPDTAYLGSPEERMQQQIKMHSALPMEQLISKIQNAPASVIKALFPQGPSMVGDLRNLTPVGAFTNIARQIRNRHAGLPEENPTFNANDVAGVAANAVAPVALGKLAGGVASNVGDWAQERPYAQLNEVSRQKGGMPISQIFKEEGIVPNDYKEMHTEAGNLLNKEYPSAINQVSQKIKSGGIQMEPPESVFSQLQNKLDQWKASKTRAPIAEVLQKDLDETTKRLQNGDFTNYGDEKGAVSKVLNENEFGVIKNQKGLSSTYNKMKGDALRIARANAAEAAEPGLGQKVLDTGNKQQALQSVAKKIGQKAIAESHSPSISWWRWFEKQMDRPGALIRGGNQMSRVGSALQSPWDYMAGKPNNGE